MEYPKHLKTGDAEPSFDQNDKLQLLSMRFCPFSQRIHLVLDAKKIPYDTTYINLNSKPEWLIKYSPYGKVPALYLKNEPGKPWIYESSIICDYLDEKYPEPPLHSKDPVRRAIDRLWTERIFNIIKGFFGITIGGLQNTSNVVTEIFDIIDSYEMEFKNRETSFFGGNSPGMLDLMIWPIFERIEVLKYFLAEKYQFSKERYPELITWTELMKAKEIVKVSYLSNDVHKKYLEIRTDGL